jgi:hypothetical protein
LFGVFLRKPLKAIPALTDAALHLAMAPAEAFRAHRAGADHGFIPRPVPTLMLAAVELGTAGAAALLRRLFSLAAAAGGAGGGG